MSSRMHVIYIPGLGDSRVNQRFNGQRILVSSWRFWGVRPHVFQMNWSDNEAFAPKLERLLKLIDSLSKQAPVGLVAASAGASAALNAWAARPQAIVGVVCIAGKINNPSTIGNSYQQKNPAFWESAQLSAKSLASLSARDRKRLLSIYGMADELVPARDSKVSGAYNRQVKTMGHAIIIATQLAYGAPRFLRFLKSQQIS